MIITIFLACILAKLKHYQLRYVFHSYSIYPVLLVQCISVFFQGSVFFGTYYFVRFASILKISAILSFLFSIIAFKLYRPAMIGSCSILLGTALNKFVISQNGGKMPVYPSLSYLTGYVTKEAFGTADSLHILGSGVTRFKFLTDYIDVGYSILSPGKFIGFKNYVNLFKDDLFWKSVGNTLYFTVCSVPVNIVIGIVIALLLNFKGRTVGLYRTVFFIPTLVPIVAVATVWRFLLDSQYGLFNQMLNMVGLRSVPWLTSEAFSKISLVMIAAWGVGQAVIINLAGLQDISPTYYEAAEVDGATAFQKMRHITLPLLTPVIFYNVVMGTINALQSFTLPYTITGGEGTPVNSLLFYVMYLYSNGFG
jgi:multiple sugar transport system permease protein